MRDGATALATREGETIIEVALPGRSYAIVIGEDLLASSGRRIAAAVKGARAAIVTDANVAGAVSSSSQSKSRRAGASARRGGGRAW